MVQMDENLKRGPIMGMLLEHDLGRNYISKLETAVEEYERGDKSKKAYIIANALSYADMLEKHIEKEDNAIYMTARRMMDNETNNNLTSEFNEIEDSNTNIMIREKYISLSKSLRKS